MRAAVLADIHGHLPALDAVLADVDAAGADAVVLLGDIAAGPLPAETLERLLALGDRAVWVGGNADREIVEAHEGRYPVTGAPHDAGTLWCGAELTSGHRDLLAGLPLTVTLDIDGLGPTLFCHATAYSDTDIVLVDSPVDRYRAAFADRPEATVVLGHTHMPFDRLVDRRRFVNAGSVGMPYGYRGASWALLGPDVHLRRTTYDVDAAARRLAGSGWPDVAGWIEAYLRSPASDAEALAVFTAAAHGRPLS